jgi:hypothetical protein
MYTKGRNMIIEACAGELVDGIGFACLLDKDIAVLRNSTSHDVHPCTFIWIYSRHKCLYV